MPRGGDHRSKPASLKKLEGNRRKISAAKLTTMLEREPKARGKPAVPAHLSPAELVEFRHVLDTVPTVILTACDQRLIENYCVAVAAAEEARAKLAATGKLVQGADGPVVNPYWRIWRQAANDARMMGNDLGLSPAARARLSVEPEKSSDPMELLLGPDEDPNGTWSTLSKTRN